MMPLSLAIIAATFTGKDRSAAIGIYGGVTGLAAAIGPLVGGLLVQEISWQSIFYLNVPIGIAGILLTSWAVLESRDDRAPRSIDVYGLITLTISLFCLVLALIQANDADKGWTSAYILTLFGVAAVAMAAFIFGELRIKHPMVDLRMFRIPSYTGAAIAAFAVSAGLFSLFFFLTLYVQNYLGFSPLAAGLCFLPLSGLVLVTAPLAGQFMHRLGAKPILSFGFGLMVVAVALMAGLTTSTAQAAWLVLLPGFILGGLGNGLVNPPIADVAVSTVPPQLAGMASGVNGVCRQIGLALGIALLGARLTSLYNAGLRVGLATVRFGNNTAQVQHSIQQNVASGLAQAGIFAASTGLRPVPSQFKAFVSQPAFPQIQQIVQHSFISGLVGILWWAAAILAVGVIAALVLMRRSDMIHDNSDQPATAGD